MTYSQNETSNTISLANESQGNENGVANSPGSTSFHELQRFALMCKTERLHSCRFILLLKYMNVFLLLKIVCTGN